MEKLELSSIASGNVKWYSHCGKQYDGSSNAKHELLNDLAITLDRRVENRDSKKYLHVNVHSTIHKCQRVK